MKKLSIFLLIATIVAVTTSCGKQRIPHQAVVYDKHVHYNVINKDLRYFDICYVESGEMALVKVTLDQFYQHNEGDTVLVLKENFWNNAKIYGTK